MATPDDSQLKTEIDEIASRIDRIVKKVKPYYTETKDSADNDDSETDERQNN